MSIIQYFDPQKNMFFVVWRRTVTAEEWFHYAAKLTSHEAWSTAPRILADLRFVTDTSTIGDEVITQVADLFSKNRKALAGKQIAVVARDQFGKARRFGELIARFGVSLVVFNNLDTGCLFLGMDLAYAASKLEELHKGEQAA